MFHLTTHFVWYVWLKATSEKGPHLSCVVFTHFWLCFGDAYWSFWEKLDSKVQKLGVQKRVVFLPIWKTNAAVKTFCNFTAPVCFIVFIKLFVYCQALAECLATELQSEDPDFGTEQHQLQPWRMWCLVRMVSWGEREWRHAKEGSVLVLRCATFAISIGEYLSMTGVCQAGRPVSHTGSLGLLVLVAFQGIDYLTPGQPYWFTWCFGVFPIPTLPLCLSSSSLLSSFFSLFSSLISIKAVTTQFPPSPPHLVDLLPRLVALKAVDPTFLTTIMITGPVALCAPPFDKLGLPLHFVVCPPASVDFLPPFCLFLWLRTCPTSFLFPPLALAEPYWSLPDLHCCLRCHGDPNGSALLDAMGIQMNLRC